MNSPLNYRRERPKASSPLNYRRERPKASSPLNYRRERPKARATERGIRRYFERCRPTISGASR